MGGECYYAAGPVGVECSDDDGCTLDDTCDAFGECTGAPMLCLSPPTSACDDTDTIYLAYASIGA